MKSRATKSLYSEDRKRGRALGIPRRKDSWNEKRSRKVTV
jgi:hypothetical protein